MAKHVKTKDRKKTIGIVSLAVLLVVALGIIAYQVFYPQQVGPDKTNSFAQSSKSSGSQSASKSTKASSTSSKPSSSSTSESTVASSSSSSSSTATAKSWSALSDKEHDAVYAQWVNNAQGKYELYTGEANLIYLVNVGDNGVSSYNDPVNVIQNTARIQINADGTYYLQVPNPSQTGLRMAQNPWPMVEWQVKETLTGDQLFAKYGAAEALKGGAAQIKSINNTGVPQGAA